MLNCQLVTRRGIIKAKMVGKVYFQLKKQLQNKEVSTSWTINGEVYHTNEIISITLN